MQETWKNPTPPSDLWNKSALTLNFHIKPAAFKMCKKSAKSVHSYVLFSLSECLWLWLLPFSWSWEWLHLNKISPHESSFSDHLFWAWWVKFWAFGYKLLTVNLVPGHCWVADMFCFSDISARVIFFFVLQWCFKKCIFTAAPFPPIA